jgi:hypothetical protein
MLISLLQRTAGALLKSQEARRAVQGGVLKKMQELEAKSGIMKSSKVRKVLRCVDVSVLLCVKTIVNEFKSHLTNNDSRHATKVLLILVQ